MKSLERRLDRVADVLDPARKRVVAFVWVNGGETPEQASARYVAEHAGINPDNTVFITWNFDHESNSQA